MSEEVEQYPHALLATELMPYHHQMRPRMEPLAQSLSNQILVAAILGDHMGFVVASSEVRELGFCRFPTHPKQRDAGA